MSKNHLYKDPDGEWRWHEHPKRKVVDACGYPYASESLGVLNFQIPEAMEFDRQHGVPTDYDKSGRPIMRDRTHRKNYYKAHNVVDKLGGFGDET